MLLYAQTAGFQFINLDDPSLITENEHVRAGLTAASIQWALTTNYFYWQPLVYLSHMLIVTLFGLDPAPHHLANALLHAANVALFFLLLRRLRFPLWPAAVAAAVFGVHPLRVESVAWVTERKDVLSAFFWMATMWAYVWYTEAPKEKRRYLAVVICFVLGLMSKPIAVTLPVCLLILDYWPLGRWREVTWRGQLLEKGPLAILAAVVAVVAIRGQQSIGAMATIAEMPLTRRLENVIHGYAVYLWMTVWPVDLAVLYPFPNSYGALEMLASVALLGGISWAVWQRRNSDPKWICAWLWYLAVAAPNIGFIQVGPVPYADRFTYLPSLLPLAAVALALSAAIPAATFRAAGAVLILLLFAMSWVQAGTWRNDITLYRHAIAAAPGASLVYLNLGVALEKMGKFNEAIANYQVAQSINESEPAPPLSIGLAYLLSGRPAEAVAPLTRAVELRPAEPGPRYHLSRALLESGRTGEAEEQVKKALTLSPENGMAATLHAQLGMAAYVRKDDAGALAEFNQALLLEPNYGPARKNAGIALGNLGRNAEAVVQLEAYLRTNPNDKDVAAAIAALRTAK